jgi:hypothetical protein
MKKLFKNLSIAILLTFILSGFTGCYSSSSLAVGEQYSNPAWAPPYYPGVRYYYLPDIEVYYDLSNQDFVYLDDGQWIFSNTLPSMYSNYDLYNCYAVALNVDVYQPWMHYHYYGSNYPRYYYKSLYRNSEAGSIRGFNENAKKPYLTNSAERSRMSEVSKNNHEIITPKATRAPQQSNYYGKNIGQPVKVQSQMRQPVNVQSQRTQPTRQQPSSPHVNNGNNNQGHAPAGGGGENHERR